MKITFHPQEMLGSVSNSCMAAFCLAQGMTPDNAAAMGGIAEGVVKGFGMQKETFPVLEKLEHSIRQAIHEAMQTDGLAHLPEEFEDEIFENAFSAASIKSYLTAEKPVELFEEKIKTALKASEIYDAETLPIETLAVGLLEKMNDFIQNDHELTALSTLYTVNEINAVLRRMAPGVSGFEEAILNMKPITEYKQPNQLHFINSKIGFYGRSQEFQWLDDFCSSPENLQYALVQGCSGAGKSRLLYEYINQHKNDRGWHLCFLNHNVIEKLLDFGTYEFSENLLVVVDYAGRFAGAVGKWILKLAESRELTNKLRIVLMERRAAQGETDLRVSVSWMQEFYGNTHQERVLKSVEYGCLTVLQLDKTDLFSVMDDYSVKVAKRQPLSNDEKEQIYTYVSDGLKMEPARQNPLFILLATDAFLCEGSVRNWDIHLLTQSYAGRMLEYWQETLCRNDKALFDSLLRVLAAATATGGIDLNDAVPDFITDDLDRIMKTGEPRTVFENASGLHEEVILPIQPDYIGEFVFLQYLNKLFPRKNRCAFCDALYCKPVEFMSFLIRCIDDFSHFDMFRPLFADAINFIKPTGKSAAHYMAFASVIANLALHIPQAERQKYADALEAVVKEKTVQESVYSDFIRFLYAGTLSNMTYFDAYDGSANIDFEGNSNWDIGIARCSVEKLRSLYKDSGSRGESVVLQLAQALANCSIYDSYKEAQACADELEKLYEKHGEEIPEISVSQAMALNNITMKISNCQKISLAESAEQAVSRLAELYEKHVAEASDYGDIAIYAVNAVSDANLRKEVDRQIRRAYARMKTRQMGVAVEYAKALNNMTGFYVCVSDDKAHKYFAELEKMYHLYKDDSVGVVIEYAKGIVAYIAVCGRTRADRLLHVVSDLCEKYKEEESVFRILLVRYAKALYNRLAIAAMNEEYDRGVDWVFQEITALDDQYKEISAELTILYIRAHYYMYYIKLCNKRGNECRRLLDALGRMCSGEDSHIADIAVQWLEAIRKLDSRS